MGCALKILNRGEGGQKQMIEKRCLILGLDNAGKTSILYRLSKKQWTTTEPTVGLNTEEVVYRDLSLSLWDLGGAAAVLWKHYYQGVDGLIFVVDSTDRARIQQAREELWKIVSEPDLEACPLLVFANKQDKEGAMNEAELSLAIEFDKYGKKHKFLQPCSALQDEGIWPGIDKLVDILIRVTPKG